MTITVDNPAFRAALAELDRAADRLHTTRRQAGRHVDGLLDGDWSGLAAEAFGEGWAGWCRGSQEVLDGLLALRRLVEEVRLGLMQQDAGTQARMGSIAQDVAAGPAR
ncbi:WXG100 family type VII secretion target [Nocardioides ungokensis]|uniref:WXG100 family type VII secretion target n=1 Tax=Nocardioides ungokensis TaxID=1643322 RepID=UPI0015DE0EC2|nr:WXG100 family type VII secretion target [Nocardioides ungokensis]